MFAPQGFTTRRMCGAPDNCAAQIPHLTLSRHRDVPLHTGIGRERKLRAEPNPLTPFPYKEGGTEKVSLFIVLTGPLGPHLIFV